MSIIEQDLPVHQPPAPPADGMTWVWLAEHMRLYGPNFTPPPHLRGLSLAYVEGKAREEGRADREARESARRIEAAPKSIERALLDGLSPPSSSSSKRAMPAQRGGRLRVRFLNHFRRCRTYREAAARIGVDESTVRRWRHKFPGFAKRCDDIVEERHRENSHDLKLRAGEPRSRPYFFRGKQISEHVGHDDRALMFLLKLDDAVLARAEERREQCAHEIRLREMEIEARLAAKGISKMPASAAQPASPVEAESAAPIKDLAAVLADIAPPRVVEVGQRDNISSLARNAGEESCQSEIV